MTRRLAAIMFTDVVGFTASTRSDEAGSLARLREQEGIVLPLFGPFGGHAVKSTGDGYLAEFESALKATECAIEIQRRLSERNSRASGSPIELRVGIHLGEVEAGGGDIFGDSVNVASRIVPLAEPGGICISAPVVDQVRLRLAYATEKLGPQSLKGIREPLDVFRVVLPWRTAAGVPKDASVPRLAVLPLTNISADPENEYFADGLTEELITVLAQIKGLRVISRTSVTQYKRTAKPVAQIGSELGADSILEGSVRRAGDQLRITVQLIDARTDEHRWSQSYDRRLENVFAIQADVAEKTATALKVELLSGEREALQERPTSSLVAYEHYLRGVDAFRRYLGWGDTKTDDEVVRCFEAAIREDPRFSGAHSYLANHLVAAMGITRSWQATIPRARELAARAIELSPSSADAHTAVANVAFQGDLDWTLAEHELQQSIALNPSSSTARFWYGYLLWALLRFAESRRQYFAAIELDPLWSLPRRNLAWLPAVGGDTAASVEAHRQLLAQLGDDARLRPELEGNLAIATALDGRTAETIALVEPWKHAANPTLQFLRAWALAVLGQRDELRQMMEEVTAGKVPGHWSLANIAVGYALLGDTEKALDFAERSQREGDRTMWACYQHWAFDPMREHPRFVAIVRGMNLPTTLPRPLWKAPDPSAGVGADPSARA